MLGGSGIRVVRGFQEGSNDGYASPREAFWIKTALITVFSGMAAMFGYGIFAKGPEPIELKNGNKVIVRGLDKQQTILLDSAGIKKFGEMQNNIKTYGDKAKAYGDSLKMAETKMTEELKKFVGSVEKQR